jgi:cobalt-zinc-cadmium efflux system protein
MSICTHQDNLVFNVKNNNHLLLVLLIAVMLFIFEIIGGIISNSLALISDAGHVLTDIFALSLSLFAIYISYRPPTSKMTYGFHRMKILTALINSLLLFVISLYIFYEAYLRLLNPPSIFPQFLLVFATIGFFVNLFMTIMLKKGNDVNIRSSYLHVLTDTIQSIGVIFGGIVIMFTHFYLVDAIISIFIGTFIMKGSLNLIKDTINVLLEAVPFDVKLEDIKSALMEINEVRDVHDVHVWCLTPEIKMLTCHIVIDAQNINKTSELISHINSILKEKFNIGHSTIQIETLN